MAEALILEFDGVGLDQYEAVNNALGLDMNTGEGDWPAGMIHHAGAGRAGGWVVFEIWESQDAQARFMEERLGKALQEGGVTDPPTRVEWLELAAFHNAADH